MAKIFQKIMKTKLVSYLRPKKLLLNNQYGFRSGKGMSQVIAKTMNLIYNNLEK